MHRLKDMPKMCPPLLKGTHPNTNARNFQIQAFLLPIPDKREILGILFVLEVCLKFFTSVNHTFLRKN